VQNGVCRRAVSRELVHTPERRNPRVHGKNGDPRRAKEKKIQSVKRGTKCKDARKQRTYETGIKTKGGPEKRKKSARFHQVSLGRRCETLDKKRKSPKINIRKDASRT